MLNTPVAFIIFNRPECTKAVFEQIRLAKPSSLFLISDAARPDVNGENDRVEASRRIAESVDWECDVRKIYAASNMGCGLRVSSGITEAFREAERLIILEDDCVPEPTFFSYCGELLDRYATEPKVASITGDNFQDGQHRGDSSYYFSKYMHCWGWATWRRAWQGFDLSMSRWPSKRASGWLESICDSAEESNYWTSTFDRVYTGKIDTWDFPWLLACWLQDGLTATPNVNLVSNIGFSADATHTVKDSPFANMQTQAIHNIRHCDAIERDMAADSYCYQQMFAPKKKRRWNQRLANWFRAA